MTLSSGLAAQIGYVQEVTVGTAVTVTRFLPLLSETVKADRARLESAGILAGRRVITSNQWNGGNQTFAGDVQHEVYRSGIGLLLTNMFGTVVTTGAGPYVHTFTPGDLTGKSMTVQIGRPSTAAGVVQPYTYAGMKVSKWQLACKAGEIASLGLSLVGMSEVTGTALAATSYPATVGRPFKFNHAAVTVGGTVMQVKSITLTGDNLLDESRRFLGSQSIAEPLENGLRAYTGTMEIEFRDLTQYNLWVNGTESALVLTFTAGADILAITMNVRFDGETPSVTGPGLLLLQCPFKGIASGIDSTAITAVYTTTDVTPT